MDGYPKNTNDAVAVFLESITTENQESKHPDFPNMCSNDKIMPQYVVMFEADDQYLKLRSKELESKENRQKNHTEAQTDKRLKIHREHNPNIQDPKHLINFF